MSPAAATAPAEWLPDRCDTRRPQVGGAPAARQRYHRPLCSRYVRGTRKRTPPTTIKDRYCSTSAAYRIPVLAVKSLGVPKTAGETTKPGIARGIAGYEEIEVISYKGILPGHMTRASLSQGPLQLAHPDEYNVEGWHVEPCFGSSLGSCFHSNVYLRSFLSFC